MRALLARAAAPLRNPAVAMVAGMGGALVAGGAVREQGQGRGALASGAAPGGNACSLTAARPRQRRAPPAADL